MNLNIALMILGIISTMGLTMSANGVIANRELSSRVTLLESRLRATERSNNALSSALWSEVVRRQQEVQRVDEAQARNVNAVQTIVRQQEDKREMESRYFQAQGHFQNAKFEAEAGRISNAKSLALIGMSVALNDRIIGCRNAQTTVIPVGQKDWISVLLPLFEGSPYQVEEVPSTRSDAPAELRVTPLRFLPGC